MATEILHSRDLLVERFHVQPTSLHRRRNFPSNGSVTTLSVNRRHNNHHHHHHNRRVSPKFDKNRFAASPAEEAKRSSHGGGAGLVMGQVTLLRRGEPLASSISSSPITPNEPVQNCQLSQIRLVAAPPADVYAGSAFVLSPSPRSVPLPSFFSKKEAEPEPEPELFEDGATRDLRRILRLE